MHTRKNVNSFSCNRQPYQAEHWWFLNLLNGVRKILGLLMSPRQLVLWGLCWVTLTSCDPPVILLAWVEPLKKSQQALCQVKASSRGYWRLFCFSELLGFLSCPLNLSSPAKVNSCVGMFITTSTILWSLSHYFLFSPTKILLWFLNQQICSSAHIAL